MTETWTCPGCGWTWTYPAGGERAALSYILGHASPCMVDHPVEWGLLPRRDEPGVDDA